MNKLDKQYLELFSDIMNSGTVKEDRTGTGTISVFGREIRHNMSEGFPLLTTKRMAWKSIVTELVWFLKGDTNIRYLVDNGCNIWNGDCHKNYLKHMIGNPEHHILDMEGFIDAIKHNDSFAKHWGNLGPIYGKQWVKWTGKSGTINQIKNLVDSLINSPDSRRLMVTAWNPDEIEDMILPPCHYGFQCYTRKLTHKERCDLFGNNDSIDRTIDYDKWLDEQGFPKRALSLKWNQRSVDVPLGLPFNIASYGILLMLLCRVTNMVPGELIGSLGDTHIYLNQKFGVHEQLLRPSHSLPSIEINDRVKPGFDLSDLNKDDIRIVNYVCEDKIDFPLSN